MPSNTGSTMNNHCALYVYMCFTTISITFTTDLSDLCAHAPRLCYLAPTRFDGHIATTPKAHTQPSTTQHQHTVVR